MDSPSNRNVSHRRPPGGSLAWLAAFLMAAVSLPASAGLISLGRAADFNALVLGDMTGRHSDVEGRLAVGGNADLEHFNIGLELEDSNGSRDDLVVGGNARALKGRINYGNGVYGGDLDTDDTFGLYSDDAPDSPNGNWIKRDSNSFFSKLATEVRGKSTRWGELGATGDTVVRKNEHDEIWEVDFRGDGSVNIFNIEATVLGALDKKIRFTVPQYSISLINVSGESASLANSGFYHSSYSGGTDEPSRLRDNQPGVYRHDGRYTDGILFNFFEAQSLSMQSIGVKGSVLAPFADLSFYNGQIDGNLIVNNWLWSGSNVQDASGIARSASDILPGDVPSTCTWCTGQVNDYRFRGEVPLPATLLLILVGLPLLRIKQNRP